jgi:hypothetical protein
MHRARIRAGLVLRRNQETIKPLSYLELRDHLWDNQREEDWIAISMVLHYFERCTELVQAKVADRELLRSMIRRYAHYWMDRYFDPLWGVSRGQGASGEPGWHESVKDLRAVLE